MSDNSQVTNHTTGSDSVVLEHDGDVLIVHLDDGKANALSAEVIAAITAALDQAEADDTIGAVVLHGRAGRFCAGFDLSVMRGGDLGAVVVAGQRRRRTGAPAVRLAGAGGGGHAPGTRWLPAR